MHANTRTAALKATSLEDERYRPRFTLMAVAERYALQMSVLLGITREAAREASAFFPALAIRRRLAERMCREGDNPDVVHGNFAEVASLAECWQWRRESQEVIA